MDNIKPEELTYNTPPSTSDLQRFVDAKANAINPPPQVTNTSRENTSGSTQQSNSEQLACIQHSAKRFALWISLFGWLYVSYWIFDTILFFVSESYPLPNYLWFCHRGVLGCVFVVLAKRIRRLPPNVVTILTTVCGLLFFRALTLGVDKEFGAGYTIVDFVYFWITGTSVSPSSAASGMGPIMILLFYTWKKSREFKKLLSQYPLAFDGQAIFSLGNEEKKRRIGKSVLLTVPILLLVITLVCGLFYLRPNTPPAENSPNYTVTRVKDAENDLPNGWSLYSIGDFAMVGIPPSMELRKGKQAEAMNKIKTTLGEAVQLDMTDSIVFQPAVLGSTLDKGKYARILISVYDDDESLASVLRDLSEKEKSDFDSRAQEKVISDMKKFSNLSPMKLISWSPTTFGMTKHGVAYVKQSFTRQMGQNPVVCLNGYAFYGQGKKTEVTISYRISDAASFSEDFTKIPDTFMLRNHIANPRSK